MKKARFINALMLAIGLANIFILYNFSKGHFKYPNDREYVHGLIVANVVWITFGIWPSFNKPGSITRVLWLLFGIFLIFQTLLGLGGSQGG